MSGPLEGLRVVELCGPLGQYAGKLLADMGADVIKVEPLSGSEARSIGPFVADKPGPNRSLNFWYHNTNKRSVALDFESNEADRERLRALIHGADILLEDNEPGWLGKLGLSFDQMASANPALIMCSITPFGQTGPWAHWKSSDMVGLALGGPVAMCGYSESDLPGAPPVRGHGDQGYNTACHFAVHGMLVALYARDATGQGQYIDCSMHEALSCTVEVGMPYYLYLRQDVVRQTGRHAALLPSEPITFLAADGKHLLLYGVGRDSSTWPRVKAWMQSLGYGPQFDEPRFADPAARQPGRGSQEAKEILQEMGRMISELPAEDIYRGGQERRQAWGVIRTPEETLQDPHWHDRGFFAGVTGEDVPEPVLMPGAPYVLNKTPWELRRPAPKLGEHTAEVLAELNLT